MATAPLASPGASQDLESPTEQHVGQGSPSLVHATSSATDITALITITGRDAFAHGGYGYIWRGEFKDPQSPKPRPVAVKMFKDSGVALSVKDRMAKRIMRETSIWSSLQHRNILPFLGVMIEGTRLPFLVSEFCKYGNASEYLRGNPTVDPLPILQQVAEALQFMHMHAPAIVHGDIKGTNVMIAMDGRALLGDFGLARITHESAFRTGLTTSTVGGSTNFMAPELLNVPDETDPRLTVQTDCYSFGCLCYELVTGLAPFHEYRNIAQLIKNKCSGIPPRRLSDCSRLTDALWALLLECWREASSRPSMTDILRSRVFVSRPSKQKSAGIQHLPTSSIESVDASTTVTSRTTATSSATASSSTTAMSQLPTPTPVRAESPVTIPVAASVMIVAQREDAKAELQARLDAINLREHARVGTEQQLKKERELAHEDFRNTMASLDMFEQEAAEVVAQESILRAIRGDAMGGSGSESGAGSASYATEWTRPPQRPHTPSGQLPPATTSFLQPAPSAAFVAQQAEFERRARAAKARAQAREREREEQRERESEQHARVPERASSSTGRPPGAPPPFSLRSTPAPAPGPHSRVDMAAVWAARDAARYALSARRPDASLR